MYKGSLLLKEPLQASVGGLHVLVWHLRQGADHGCPSVHLLLKTIRLWLDITQVAAQVAAACDDGEAPPLEEAFVALDIWLRYDQDALCRIREITSGGACTMMLSMRSWMSRIMITMPINIRMIMVEHAPSLTVKQYAKFIISVLQLY